MYVNETVSRRTWPDPRAGAYQYIYEADADLPGDKIGF
jgi:hypothetical protein